MSDKPSMPVRVAPIARWRAGLMHILALSLSPAIKLPPEFFSGKFNSGKTARRATRGAAKACRHPSARTFRGMAVPKTPFIQEATEL